MRGIDELLAEAPAFAGMSREYLELIAGCAHHEAFSDGDYLMREGEPANRFFVVRKGRVALETSVPARGALTIETLEQNELLGWSWLVNPQRTDFDARAQGKVETISFDGACLRGKIDSDPVLGYEMLKRFAPVIVERLQATRLRLLDVYGQVADG
jgi:CRP/FNR family cyclic AMP-dependent transcriptional regulator